MTLIAHWSSRACKSRGTPELSSTSTVHTASVIPAALPGVTAAAAWAIQHTDFAEALEANYLRPGPTSREGISALRHTYCRTPSLGDKAKRRTPQRTPQEDCVPCIRSAPRACARCAYSSTLSRDTTRVHNLLVFLRLLHTPTFPSSHGVSTGPSTSPQERQNCTNIVGVG